MSEEIDYAARVAKGFALFDEKWPNWATEINLDTLDISSGTRCMTAQYSAVHGGDGHWRSGRLRLGLDLDEYQAHGFNAEGADDDIFATLNGLWRAEIKRRRALT